MRSMCPDCGKTTVPSRTGTKFCTECRTCYVCGGKKARERSRDERWPGDWCSKCLQRWRRTQSPEGRQRLYRASVEDRFWFHVGPPDPVTGCREWSAGKSKKGYGIFRYSDTRRTMGAHRAALILVEGREVKGADVLHRCDNPGCVEPTHLRWGTNAENMADRLEREGYSTRKKLTPEQVVQIKQLLTEGKLSQRRIGELYEAGRGAIGKIARGETWKYI